MKVHQNIIIDGQDLGDADYRKHSKFYNEGKWNNFIAPLLPDGQIFVEFGSNAGLYLKLASEKYSKVIGYERSRNDCEVAKKYRDSLGLDFEIIRTQIDDKLEFMADVVLMANFHYHQHITEFINLLDSLETKTCYVLIVSVNHDLTHWRAQPNEKNVEGYFKHWDLISKVSPIDPENDPHPRDMFSYLFKSRKLKRIPLSEVKLKGELKKNENMKEFIYQILNKNVDIKETSYYKTQLKTRYKWSTEKVDRYLEEKKNLILDVKKNGIQKPIVLEDGYLVDGLHRFLIATCLGQESIIAR